MISSGDFADWNPDRSRLVPGNSGPGGYVFYGAPDIEYTLERHGDDGTGYCKATCNLRGWQYPTGTCPPAKAAAEARDRLLADRSRR
ncbi:MAG TPA: hypothetical protein VIP77_16100 [Jiangellaceae bacterium]